MTVAGGGLYASNPMFGIRVGCISVWKPNASRPKIDAQMIAYVARAALVFLVWMSDGAKSQVALCIPDRGGTGVELAPRTDVGSALLHWRWHATNAILRERGSTMRIHRRKFLKTSGGALAGILATGRAPAYAQVITLHWLRLGDFVPASDTLLRQELLPQAEKALGLKITFETINGNDLQARITSAIQSGNGADIIHAMHNWPHLYADSLAEVSDVADEIGGQQGGFYDIFPTVAKSDRGWLGCRGARSASCCVTANPGSARLASANFRRVGSSIA